jgi:hypothetical protein
MEMLATRLSTIARAPIIPISARFLVDANSFREFAYSSLIFFIKNPPFSSFLNYIKEDVK